ncbi:hypothetical protein F53441_4898 [Fusarium austroafricanum]|uniref:C2H2-type domain-containing protein n=1 Tax=Fusarium austroafricanum TaxID=2364996 RepID=A0A8H4NY84_9HYPO|nr:hypothetical protein F53441_4898 [Fusarium austroafricanum]
MSSNQMNIDCKSGTFEPDIFMNGYPPVDGEVPHRDKKQGLSGNGASTASISISRRPRRRSTIPPASSSRALEPVLSFPKDAKSSPQLPIRKISSEPSKKPAREFKAPQKKRGLDDALEDIYDADDSYGQDEDNNDVNKTVETYVCPYYRKDPERHFGCIHHRMPRIPDVKQHLKRRHTSKYSCSRCSKGFVSLELFEDHVRQQNCSTDLSANTYSVSPATQDALKVRFKRGLSTADQWHKIWKLLFGDSEVTQNPYHDGVFKEITGIIQGIWREEGHHIISNLQRTRDIPPICAEHLHTVLLELLAEVGTRFERRSAQTSSKDLFNENESNFKDPIVDTTGPHTSTSSGAGILSTSARPFEGTVAFSDSTMPYLFSGADSVKKICRRSMFSGSQCQQTEMPCPDLLTTELALGSGEPWQWVEPDKESSKGTLIPDDCLEGIGGWFDFGNFEDECLEWL